MNHPIRRINNPAPASIPEQVEDFLTWLAQPSCIYLQGQDSSRSRFIVTLLHGNEPSGLKAIHRYLRAGITPEVDLYLLIANVEVALTYPRFSWRHLPDRRDLNRCFRPPYEDEEGRLAAAILRLIEQAKPEVVIDIHNTSGDGPPFSVCSQLTPEHSALTSYFTHRLVLTDLHLGALMETTRAELPAITIECGGARGSLSDECAFRGLSAIASVRDLYRDVVHQEMDLYCHPVRLELTEGADIQYADCPDQNADITLPTHIDQRNFGIVTTDIALGWVEDSTRLRLKVADRYQAIDEYFVVREGQLYPASLLKLFMVTTNPRIARSDCILYAAKELDHQHFAT